jgi:hypothetical protein
VEAGNEVPELLIRYADERDPKDAVEYYRKAVQSDWPSTEGLIKLGKALAATGRRPLAEACWRRAWDGSRPDDRKEICRLLGIPEPKEEE